MEFFERDDFKLVTSEMKNSMVNEKLISMKSVHRIYGKINMKRFQSRYLFT